jgi:kumamolisin
VLEAEAAAGITLIAASGDNGSADCDNNGISIARLGVDYPASSSWVTGVGGTNLTLSAGNAIVKQTAWNDGRQQPGSAGGGGISELFGRPSYQNAVVTSTQREVPDVAMLADIIPGYATYCSAAECVADDTPRWQSQGGTSAAVPLLAGGIALIDSELSAQHRPALGFLNPLIYQLAQEPAAGALFNDVTQLGNDVGPYIPGFDRSLGCCQATPGYDDAAGWGSVNIAQLEQDAPLTPSP